MIESRSTIAGLPVLLYTPEAAADSNELLPVIVFLHGSGEAADGDASEDTLDDVKEKGLPYLAAEGLLPRIGGREFPMLVAAPQVALADPDRETWAPHTKAGEIRDLLEELIEKHHADRRRCLLTGISVGAYAVWENAAEYPGSFAALVAVSGGAPPEAKQTAQIPALVLSGGEDPKDWIRDAPPRLVELRRGGAETKVDVDEKAGHDDDFWNDAYARRELYDWLLRHEARTAITAYGLDSDGRRRVGPGKKKKNRPRLRDRIWTHWDRVWPQRHGKWWNFKTFGKREAATEFDPDKKKGRTKTRRELATHLAITDETAEGTLLQVQAIGQTAVDRAAAADRRATTIAGTVTIAASFVTGGAGLFLDSAKIQNAAVRSWLAVIFAVTILAFLASAGFALRALVATRTWNWVDPGELDSNNDLDEVFAGLKPQNKRLGVRAAHLLQDFAGNWELSDLKNRNVDNALRCLVAGLSGVAALAVVLAVYVVRA